VNLISSEPLIDLIIAF